MSEMVGATRPRLGGPGVFTQREGRRLEQENRRDIQPAIEIPGDVVLPVRIFKLLDSSSNRHIVQIFNQDQTHIYVTILAIPNWRLSVTDKTVMTFGERVAGEPQAIRSWFLSGG